jgi:hypothetical protein
MLKFTAIPDGYTPPYSWGMARISGGLASHTLLTAAISGTGTVNGGKALVAALRLVISLTPLVCTLIIRSTSDMFVPTNIIPFF